MHYHNSDIVDEDDDGDIVGDDEDGFHGEVNGIDGDAVMLTVLTRDSYETFVFFFWSFCKQFDLLYVSRRNDTVLSQQDNKIHPHSFSANYTPSHTTTLRNTTVTWLQ